MISFYIISHKEASSKAIFVIKIDDIEVIKFKKLERVSIAFMNRVLSTTIANNTAKKFSVHFEKNLWWLGYFEVDLEDFNIL